MKYLIGWVLLSILVAIASCQQQGYPGAGGGNRQKPGTCYRPGGGNGGGWGSGRYGRSALADGHEKPVVKRQYQPAIFGVPRGFGGSQGGNGIIGSGGGSQGGNGGGSQGGNGWGNVKRCYGDYDCQGNKKCCSGNCQTPSFVG